MKEGFGRKLFRAIIGDEKVVATPMKELSNHDEDELKPATLFITSDPYIVTNLYGELLLERLNMEPDLEAYPMHHFKILDRSFGFNVADRELLETGEATDYKHIRRRIVAVVLDTMMPEVLKYADRFRQLGIPVTYSPRVESVVSLIRG